MTKRRSWASWFPIAKTKPMGFDSPQHAARNQNSWGAMKDLALMTNEERAYLGLRPIVHTFTPGGDNG